MAALSAAAMLVTTVQQSSAQTWNAPNPGNWSVPANWTGGVVPVPGPTTALLFPGNGVAYTSNNDLAAFTFGSLTFANSGAAAINLTGNPFSGGLGTSGPYIRVNSTGSGASVVNTGGTLYSMRTGQGSMTVNGGAWTLTSTQRQNDDLASNDGFWSFDVGDTAGQTARFTQTGGTISGTIGGFVANDTGAIGIATFTGASTVMNVLDGRFGVNKGTGTINVLAGAKVNTRLIEAGRSAGAISNILVDGAGSQINAITASTSGQLYMGRSTIASSSMTISNGGLVTIAPAPTLAGNAAPGQFITAANPNAVTTLNVLSGGQLQMQGNLFINNAVQTGGVGDPADTTTNFLIDGANSVLNVATFAQNNGTTAFAGGQITLAAQFGGTATMTFSNGGRGFGANTFVGNGGVVTGGVGSILISSGGQFDNSNQLVVESDAAPSMVRVNNGTFTNVGSTFLSTNPNDLAILDVNGGSFINGGQIQVSGSGTIAGGVSTLSISNNGFVSANGGTTSLVAVFTKGVVNIGSGTSKGTLIAGDLGTAVDGTINFNAGTFRSVGTLGVGGSVLLSSAGRAANGTASNKKMVEAGIVDLTTSGVIDLNDNDMLIHDTTAGALQKYEGYVKAARHGGLWDLAGITSTAAKIAAPKNKNLGVIKGSDYTGGTFNGKTVVATDTLIKFTFNGDTDLNGKVDFDDYSHTDNGFNNHRTGWFNGDFDYNGTVDFDDYSLIDQAFNTQGAVVLNIGDGGLAGPAGDRTIVSVVDQWGSVLKTHQQSVQAWGEGSGQLQAVPEPATLGLAGVALLGALSRRRRSVR